MASLPNKRAPELEVWMTAARLLISLSSSRLVSGERCEVVDLEGFLESVGGLGRSPKMPPALLASTSMRG
jgi:hypothetical protein